MSSKKYVVTGGAGFIGSRLVDALREQGALVKVIDDLSRPVDSIRGLVDKDLHKLDVVGLLSESGSRLFEIFGGADAIFHLAAKPSVPDSIENPVEYHRTNVSGTLVVLECARMFNIRKVIFSSSSAVYGEPTEIPTPETAEMSPQSPYALHKLIGEEYCKLYSELFGISSVALRYFNVYGPGHHESGAYAPVIAHFLKLKREGKPLTITGDGTQRRDFIHVDDVVAANIKALPFDYEFTPINIGTGGSYSVNEIANLIGGMREHIDARVEPHDSMANITRARELLEWEPSISLEQGIADLHSARPSNYIC